jgi:hypothetical protein
VKERSGGGREAACVAHSGVADSAALLLERFGLQLLILLQRPLQILPKPIRIDAVFLEFILVRPALHEDSFHRLDQPMRILGHVGMSMMEATGKALLAMDGILGGRLHHRHIHLHADRLCQP